jgi:hypothetical protein
MTTYTNNLKLALPGEGSHNWKEDADRNAEIYEVLFTQLKSGNGIISGGNLSGASLLEIDIDETVVNIGGIDYSISAQTLTLTADSNNWIYMNSSGIQVATSPPSSVFAMIGCSVTDATVVLFTSNLNQKAPAVDQVIHLQHQETSGTSSGSISSGYNTRDLNTVILNTISGASLSSNLVTLPIGTYEIDGMGGVGDDKTIGMIRDSLDITLLSGINSQDRSRINIVRGRIVLSVTTSIKFVSWFSKGVADGFGKAIGSGRNEVYSDLFIKKIR